MPRIHGAYIYQRLTFYPGFSGALECKGNLTKFRIFYRSGKKQISGVLLIPDLVNHTGHTATSPVTGTVEEAIALGNRVYATEKQVLLLP